MIPKLDRALDFHGEALKLRARRQEVLAGNLANGDTPGYQAVDFDFGAALRGALAGERQQGLERAHAAHLAPRGGAPAVTLQYRMPLQPSVDNNTVDMDGERTRFADNAVRYEAALAFLNGQIKAILAAIER